MRHPVARMAWCCQPDCVLVVLATSLAWILGVGLLVVLVRTAWLGITVRRAVARLPRHPLPAAAGGQSERSGVGDVTCLWAPRAAAFCAGFLRPRIYVTTALLQQLRVDELEAVLEHERAHARRRDPLRRALAQALAEVFFFIPLLQWWSEYDHDRSEMHADLCAIRRVGRASIASAILHLSTRGESGTPAAFMGRATVRVAHILGDQPPRRRPDAWQWAVSILGLAGVVYLVSCPIGVLLFAR